MKFDKKIEKCTIDDSADMAVLLLTSRFGFFDSASLDTIQHLCEILKNQ